MFCWRFFKNRCFTTTAVVTTPLTTNLSLSLPSNLQSSAYGNISRNDANEYLCRIEYKDTLRFVPPLVSGKVIKVYDGDTITIASKIPNTNLPIYRFSVRLAGIDSAEIKGHTEVEKSVAIKARDALNKLIYGKIVTLHNVKTEKYGRILADVYLDKIHINQWMLSNNYAVPYDGGKKIRPDGWNELDI